jgi:hypothetical protein
MVSIGMSADDLPDELIPGLVRSLSFDKRSMEDASLNGEMGKNHSPG